MFTYDPQYTKDYLISLNDSRDHQKLIDSFFDCFKRKEAIENGRYGIFKPLDAWKLDSSMYVIYDWRTTNIERDVLIEVCNGYIKNQELRCDTLDRIFINSLAYAELIATHRDYFKVDYFWFSLFFPTRSHSVFHLIYKGYATVKNLIFSHFSYGIILLCYLFLRVNWELISIIFAYLFIKSEISSFIHGHTKKWATGLEGFDAKQIEKMLNIYIRTCDLNTDLEYLLTEMNDSKKDLLIRWDGTAPLI